MFDPPAAMCLEIQFCWCFIKCLLVHRMGPEAKLKNMVRHYFSCMFIQSCLTLCDSMDCCPSGSSGHGDSAGKNTGVDCHVLLAEHGASLLFLNNIKFIAG